jgi:beta-glucanase (GH16 family)
LTAALAVLGVLVVLVAAVVLAIEPWRAPAVRSDVGASPTGGSPEEPAGTGPDGLAGSWSLVISDDFDGTELNRDLWQPNRYGFDQWDAPFNPDGEEAFYAPSNAKVSDGHLVLSLERDPQRVADRSYDYRSGMVRMAEGRTVAPGSYVEARIDIPRCDGCWPAFWSVAPDTWPPEIDIFEFFDTGAEGETRPKFNYFRPTGGQRGTKPYGVKGVDYREGFHTYGLLWDGAQAVPYLDGVAYPEAGASQQMTEMDQAIIMNLAVFSGGRPENSEMRVDWFRVWVPGTSAATGTPEAGGATAEGGTPPATPVPPAAGSSSPSPARTDG